MCIARLKGTQNQPQKNIFSITLKSSKLKNKNNSKKKETKKKKKHLLFVKEHYVPGGKVESGKLQQCVKGR